MTDLRPILPHGFGGRKGLRCVSELMSTFDLTTTRAQYLDLDDDHNGLLSKRELLNYSTYFFIIKRPIPSAHWLAGVLACSRAC